MANGYNSVVITVGPYRVGGVRNFVSFLRSSSDLGGLFIGIAVGDKLKKHIEVIVLIKSLKYSESNIHEFAVVRHTFIVDWRAPNRRRNFMIIFADNCVIILFIFS